MFFVFKGFAQLLRGSGEFCIATMDPAAVASPIHLDWATKSRELKQSNIEMRIRREWEANDSHRVNTVLKTWVKDREQERLAKAKQKAELRKQREEAQKIKFKERKTSNAGGGKVGGGESGSREEVGHPRRRRIV